MYTYAGIGLLGLFVLMMLPSNITLENEQVPRHYGAATLVYYDVEKNEVFRQTVHNHLVDTGETFILQNTFNDGTADVSDGNTIGAICVTDGGGSNPTTADTETAASFDTANTITENNCEQDPSNSVTLSAGVATIGPLTFQAATGDNNVGAGDTIRGIGICQNTSANDNDFNDCATNGILFSVVNTSDVTLASGESVDVTYTFDISASGS